PAHAKARRLRLNDLLDHTAPCRLRELLRLDDDPVSDRCFHCPSSALARCARARPLLATAVPLLPLELTRGSLCAQRLVEPAQTHKRPDQPDPCAPPRLARQARFPVRNNRPPTAPLLACLRCLKTEAPKRDRRSRARPPVVPWPRHQRGFRLTRLLAPLR